MSTNPINAAIDAAVKPVPPPTENPDNLPYPTHAGTVKFGGVEMRCYVLNTGVRIFHQGDIMKLLGGMAK